MTRPYDGKMVSYLDMVGKMHTPKAGSKELDVPLVQMNALMGFVTDAVIATITSTIPVTSVATVARRRNHVPETGRAPGVVR